MNLHRNARTTPISRAEMARRVVSGQSPMAGATALGIDAKTVRKWVGRFHAEGLAGLRDRSSRPHWHRPHGGIKSQTPISRLGFTEDNLLRLHS